MEEWKIIAGYENYAVSNTGKIKSLRFGRILKLANSDSGYLYVNLVCNKIYKTHSVHRLVMESFGPPKPTESSIIDHVDIDKNNNIIDNLQWITVKENTEKYYNNYDKKIKILEMHDNGYSVKEIRETVGMSISTIHQTILKSKIS